MRKGLLALSVIALMMSQISFADDTTMTPVQTDSAPAASAPDNSTGKPCDAIAVACVNSGYNGSWGTGKMFWMDCMKPLLLGKSVEGVTIEQTSVSSCRTIKISEFQNEITELKHVQ